MQQFNVSATDQFVVWPVWVMIGLLQPFLPPEHPFKRTPTLDRWAYYATPLCRAFGIFFWLQSIPILALLAFVLL